MRKWLLFSGLFMLCLTGFAQSPYWQAADEAASGRSFFTDRERPSDYKIFQLQPSALRTVLQQSPSERSLGAAQSNTLVSIPDPSGQLRYFRIVEAPVMDPSLNARYPDIRSYAGVDVADPSATIRFSMSPLGFHAMILSARASTVYIDPLGDDYYLVVSRSVLTPYRESFGCLTPAIIRDEISQQSGLSGRNADDGRLRSYRLALCATGEFSAHWLNGTETTDAERKGKVLAAMNNFMTRANGIFERDFAVRLNLVANNDAVIYLNASTDPFTTSTSWNSQTQSTCDGVIGSANYDIGHMVTKGGNNGNAGCIGCVCVAGSKGSGWTSYSNPSSDFFVVDYLCHEIGHQMGGNHTFTHSNEGTIAQVEPGSGSTIMGYAGITGATTDVQPNSDDYFHAITIQQVTNYMEATTCPTSVLTGNAVPTANAGLDYVIPRSTPFTLTGSGSDANPGDVLSFCWEQNNVRATGFSTVPSATATAGPQFRSYRPVSSTSRTFPEINSILNGTNGNKWEVLPSVARTLNFRFTVRDNRPGGAANNSDDMVLTINGTAGPFAVTAPNTAVTWNAGTSQTVTWSVNSTNLSPVNCTSVNILLSTDGGLTFPTVLAAGTPNDGSQAITVPTVNSTTCRIRVEAANNIFFDISNANFTINGTPPACGDPTGLSASAITTSSATVSWTAVSGALSYDVDYKANSSATWINAATGTTSTTVNLSGLTSGTLHDWRVRANCSGGSGNYVSAQFTTTSPCNAPTGLAASAITATSATVSWTAVSGASNYTVEYKANSSATWITAASATTATSVSLSGLSASTLYDWRVRTNCASGSSAFSQAQFTTAAASVCPGIYDVSTNGTLSGAATIPLNTDIRGLISPSGDNDYYRFVITTGGTATITLSTLPADYDIRLYNSAGTQLAISQNGGTSNETISRTYTAGTYFVRVYGYQNANNASNCYTLRVQRGTATRGEELVTQTPLTAFPNPARNTVTLQMPGLKGMADIRVFDMYGKLVQTQTSSQPQVQVSLARLPRGIYLVKVSSEAGEETVKVVKE